MNSNQPDVPTEFRVKAATNAPSDEWAIAMYEVKDGVERGLTMRFDSYSELLEAIDALYKTAIRIGDCKRDGFWAVPR